MGILFYLVENIKNMHSCHSNLQSGEKINICQNSGILVRLTMIEWIHNVDYFRNLEEALKHIYKKRVYSCSNTVPLFLILPPPKWLTH